MPESPEKLDLKSVNLSQEKRQELIRLFPEVCTEAGKIDFDRLKLVLGEAVDVGKERYGMHWPGKADCFKTIQAPSMGTLRPCSEESVAFDTTENLIIEGDNLEVLKLLQKSYLGRVKMIYIDPPYNTGNDFIYPDNYSESLQTYLEYTGQVDGQGRKFGTNTDTDGRFHSKWLNMMYPRLYLARNLLQEDGFIFISIDDNEQNHLIELCKEIFGAENFVGMITRNTGTSTGGGSEILVNIIDYIVVFSKSKDTSIQGLPYSEEDAKIYDQEDERGRFLSRSLRRTGGEPRREDRPSMFYPISGPDGVEVYPIGPGGYESRWVCGRKKYEEHVKNGLIQWKQILEGERLLWKPFQKFYLEGRKKQPSNLWTEVEGNKKATRDVRSIFNDQIFDSPKPVELISKCIGIGADDNAIVLDFFAGSGTTAQSVIESNKQEGFSRKFILVQLPEPTGRTDYPTIAEITKERVRRVISARKLEDAPKEGELINEVTPELDLGFRVFKLSDSNFKPWDAEVKHQNGALVQQLELYIDHIKENRTNQDLLFEILLKRGFPLTTPVEVLNLVGKQVYGVAGNMMLVCLERDLNLDLIRAMADVTPECVVCLDEGFAGNDQLKTNAVQIFKTKGVAKFLTV